MSANFWGNFICLLFMAVVWLRWPRWRWAIAWWAVLSMIDSANTLWFHKYEDWTGIPTSVFWISLGVAGSCWLEKESR